MQATDRAASRELRSAELRAERVSAAIRLVVFFSLLAVFTSADSGYEQASYVASSVTIYGIVAAAAALLAWRRVFHPVLAYALVTVDVVLVAFQLTLLVRLFGLTHATAYSVPAAGLIFLVLAQAALRFRPVLVLYAAALFIGVLEGSRLILPEAAHAAAGSGGEAGEAFLYGHALPLTVIALTALALWVAGAETRRMLERAIEQAGRAANLSRFFSPAVADRLSAIGPVDAATGDRRNVGILFVDIQGFTVLGQRLAPHTLATLLSEFREAVTVPVFEMGGAIDKFIGDGALILFGSPEKRPDDAVRAIRCGRRILESVAQWSHRRAAAGEHAVRIGIGGHYGEVFAGVLGKNRQLEFTVIGDAVNIAERIERLTRLHGTDMVISEDLLRAAGLEQSASWKLLPVDTLPGHGAHLRMFGLSQDACIADRAVAD